MGLISQIFSTILALSLIASPAGTLFGASTSTAMTTTPSTVKPSDSSTALVGAGLAVGAGLLLASQLFSAPIIKSPFTSFGGRIISVIPCSGGMLHVTIIPAGIFPVTYIWTPATVTKSYGPPRNPGQKILGLADIPFVCFVGGGLFTAPVPLYGLRMMIVGTSLR